MTVQRFSFKEFGNATPVVTRSKKPFTATGKGNEEAPPPPPTFSEEELKTAERNGYKQGFLEGEKEGRKQAESDQAAVDRKLTETVEKFAGTLPPLFADYRKTALLLQEQTPKIALAIARKVAGLALAQNAEAVISEIALRALESMVKEPKITITVHDSLADTLSRKLEKSPSAADIVVQRDPNLPVADCRIEWNQGGMERQTAQIWEQIEKTIEDMIATATRDTNEQLEEVKKEVLPKEDGTSTKP